MVSRQNILVLGDSHTDVFEYSNKKQSATHFHVCGVGGEQMNKLKRVLKI